MISPLNFGHTLPSQGSNTDIIVHVQVGKQCTLHTNHNTSTVENSVKQRNKYGKSNTVEFIRTLKYIKKAASICT
jgi:hypothetical protein